MRRSTLDASAAHGNIEFNSCRILRTSEALICGFTSSDDRAGQELFVDLCIDLLNLVLEHGGILFGCMRGMTLLPKELTSTNERRRVLELPSYDIGPLVEEQGQVTVRPDPLGVGRVHDCFRGRPDRDGLRHLTLAGLGDPSDFGRETLNMVLFFI